MQRLPETPTGWIWPVSARARVFLFVYTLKMSRFRWTRQGVLRL